MRRPTAFASALAVALTMLAHGVAAQETWWHHAAGSEASRAMAKVLGSDAAVMWQTDELQPELRLIRDEILQRDVLAADGPVTMHSQFLVGSNREVSCRVRLATTTSVKSSTFRLSIAGDPDDANSPGLVVDLSGTHDGAIGGFIYKPYPTISPALEPSIRAPLERDMAGMAMSQDRWIPLRIQIGEGWARGWIDDRLAWEKRGEELHLQGVVGVRLGANARMTDFTVRALPESGAQFETIALDGYVAARDLEGGPGTAVADGALPFGRTVLVEGVPMRFVDRRTATDTDHIDIGRSLFRQGNWPGYHPASGHRFVGTSTVDPARIQLRIPNGRYDAMYVVAAFDGDENSVPALSAMFYRPSAGFPMVFEISVPSLYQTDAEATPLPVKLENGKQVNLWLVKIPLSPAMLASFSDMDMLEVELTKKVYQYRSYPDPYMYGWHQGGLPSGVRVYALTLHRPEMHMTVEPTIFGHVWKHAQTPSYTLHLANRAATKRTVELTVDTTSYDGEEKSATQEKTVTLEAGEEKDVTLSFNVEKFGIHRLVVTMKDGDQEWIERRNFCRLAPDTRAAKWEEGKGVLFGYWSYHGGHYTPPQAEHLRLMTMAGARATLGGVAETTDPVAREIIEEHAVRGGPNPWPISPQWSWAGEEPIDPAKYDAYKKTAVDVITEGYPENPELIAFYPEPHISRNVTTGHPQDYWGEPDYQFNEHEQKSLRVFMNTSRAAAEAVRAEWPNAKILIPWGDPLFVVPLLRAGFPRHLIDGSALDMIGFERLPEQQLHQMSTHRLYILLNEYRKFGMDKPLLPYVEGTFVPTEPGAVTWDEQADLYHRWSLISLAYGIERFYSGWFAFDCGNYYGAEHYGGCGIQRRIPYADPKPAYAHFATMTRALDQASFDKWTPTGSLTTYCLRFIHATRGATYCLWTVRGERSATLMLAEDATVRVTDSMDNSVMIESSNRQVTIELSTSPVYVTGIDHIDEISLGEPDHSGAVQWARTRNQQTWHSGPLLTMSVPEIQHEKVIASLGDGTWTNVREQDRVYETNNHDTQRFLGDMSVNAVTDPQRPGAALAVKLHKQDRERKLMPWYTVLKPSRPVVIPGRASALGLWAKASSDWGRVVYCLRDAKDERWISIGHKDEWNCDDVHSWSSFNFDGWRYLRFELPGHLPYDNFRQYGTTFWRYAGGDRIVDLPLTVEKIIIERRTHILYVNDIQPTNAQANDVLLGDLVAEYGSAEDATEQAVQLSQVRMPAPTGKVEMPNPIVQMAQDNDLPPIKLLGVKDPDWGYDGTRCHVNFEPVPDAKQYQIWVAAHPDGRGAQAMAQFNESGQILQGLRPATRFYLWVTYTDQDGKQSMPSNMLDIELVDAFGMK